MRTAVKATLRRLRVPFVGRRAIWSIGIYRGDSPTRLEPHPGANNPVLTAADVTDAPALFVADPFCLREGSQWYMFFEVMNAATGKGDIGLAVSGDGLTWSYQQIVITGAYHLSYPYVLKSGAEHYLVRGPLTYRATDFPFRWEVSIGSRPAGHDGSMFQHGGYWWWLIASPGRSDTLRLYYADQLFGQWTEHPASPIVEGNSRIARPAGRVTCWDGGIIRYAQDDHLVYGNAVRAARISALTRDDYQEEPVSERPVLQGTGSGWNSGGMHHVDPVQLDDGQWLACVDGFKFSRPGFRSPKHPQLRNPGGAPVRFS